MSEQNSLSPARRLSEILWKEESLERSFYPWNLRKLFEKKFNVMSSDVQKVFVKARELSYGAMSIKLKRNEEK